MPPSNQVFDMPYTTPSSIATTATTAAASSVSIWLIMLHLMLTATKGRAARSILILIPIPILGTQVDTIHPYIIDTHLPPTYPHAYMPTCTQVFDAQYLSYMLSCLSVRAQSFLASVNERSRKSLITHSASLVIYLRS